MAGVLPGTDAVKERVYHIPAAGGRTSNAPARAGSERHMKLENDKALTHEFDS